MLEKILTTLERYEAGLHCESAVLTSSCRELEQQLRSDHHHRAMLSNTNLSPVSYHSTCNLPEVSVTQINSSSPCLQIQEWQLSREGHGLLHSCSAVLGCSFLLASCPWPVTGSKQLHGRQVLSRGWSICCCCSCTVPQQQAGKS